VSVWHGFNWEQKMSNTNTGGPAFPIERQTIAEQYGSVGMTLRDYFAAKAMQGLLELTPKDKQQWTNKIIAETAYGMADAMMKAREA
jgi:hypothetical protein